MIDFNSEHRRTIRKTSRTKRRFSFPDSMPFHHRRKYVEIHREINFNEKFKINEDYNELLKDSAHQLIATYLTPND